MSRRRWPASAVPTPIPNLQLGERITLQVDRLSLGGDAIGRVGQAVVFVSYGCPGDTLEVELTDVRRNFCRARLLRVIEASPVRVDPPCPYHFSPESSVLSPEKNTSRRTQDSAL